MSSFLGVLTPFNARESISPKVAAKRANKSVDTIRLWAEKHGLGRKIGGQWEISRVCLNLFLNGDATALEAYHDGDRTSDRVVSYYRREGLPPPDVSRVA